jgi:hypothetical protein
MIIFIKIKHPAAVRVYQVSSPSTCAAVIEALKTWGVASVCARVI